MCRGGQTQKLKVQILCFSDKGGGREEIRGEARRVGQQPSDMP